MATPQEAKPDASSELPGDSPAIGGSTAQPQANAGAPSTEAIKADPPPGDASSHDTAGRAAPIEMIAEAPSEAAEEPAAAGGAAAVAAPARSSRFALLAASLALAAGLGAVVGSLSASGLAHLSPVAAAAPKSGMAEANALQAMKAELAELSALKASLDGTARNANGQFAKIVERLDRVERAQIEPAAKIAHMAEAIDRLEKKNVMAAASAAPETTGAIPNKQPAAPAETKLPDKILQNWVVQDVRRGRALVENSYGGVFAVAAGSTLPGLGVVESIKRQDGQWVVVTARGVITEH
jgi:hypothetical protein